MLSDRPLFMGRWLLAALMICMVALVPAHGQTFPALTGRVVDGANLLSPAENAELSAKLEALETQSRRQLVVATVPDLQGYEIEDYGYQLGRTWGIGDKERNDGVLFLIAPNERKVRIEVGYGMEGILTDALSSLIIQNDILPRFRDNDMPGGILAGADALIQQLSLPEDEARAVALQAAQESKSSGNGDMIFFWIMIAIFIFMLSIVGGLNASSGRKHRRGAGPVVIWGSGSGSDWGGGGGGSSWGGGGGFSGGGGSFGGGGASGGW